MTFRWGFLAAVSVAAAFLSAAPAARAMTVSPPTIDLPPLDRGASVSQIIHVTNEEAAPILLRASAVNFGPKAGDESSGIPEFYPADEDKDGRAMAAWIEVPAGTIAIAPGARQDVVFKVTVPDDAQPGSHFGAIHLSRVSASEDAGPQVGVIGATSILVLARVNGDVTESLDITRFSGDRKAYASLPIDLQVRVQNTGTVHLRPSGAIIIRDMFGREAASLPVNPDFRSVLPGTARRFDATWLKRPPHEGESGLSRQWRNFAFGPYTAQLILTYGESDIVSTGEYRFTVIPWLVLSILIGGAVGLFATLRFGLAAYSRRLIAKYEKNREPQQK